MNLKFIAVSIILLLVGTEEGRCTENSKTEFGVYEYVVRKAQGTFQQLSANLEASVVKERWTMLATVNAGTPEDCSYKSKVFVVFDSVYARTLMQINSTTAPFAIVDRINLFEDEEGIHISVVNPQSILRTVLMDDTAYQNIAHNHLASLRKIISSAVHGEESTKQYGELRDEGFIGKTMGVMAGGKFSDKIENIFTGEKKGLKEFSAGVDAELRKPGKEWGIHEVYRLEVPEFKTVVYGVTGTPLDSKSFSIVKEGSDDSRSDFKCPGIAHAGAYPFEIVLVGDESSVKVKMVESMFRMKMYFEDAGKWAFMKNMGMPGSITDEVKSMLKPALGNK